MTDSTAASGRMLVVDDNRVNRLVLQRALEALGHETMPAGDGLEALSLLSSVSVDAVLLDVEMPGLDGFGTLTRIKEDPQLAHLPVIMVSGVEEIESVVRCIELGAVDYLQKPFDAALLRARVDSALAAKRTRDIELDIFEQVSVLVDAAEAVEGSAFDPSLLQSVAARSDPIGALGRVFLQMAEKVVEREQRLRHQIEQLVADSVAAHLSVDAPVLSGLASYVAIDRRLAMAAGAVLPNEASGAALMADLSGFTSAAVARSRRLGSDRGAEELLVDLNHFYDRCVSEIHRFGGAVVGFAGDGITAWFDDGKASVDAGAAAVSAGLALQQVAAGEDAFDGLKVAVTAGEVRRLVVGTAEHRLLDVLLGAPVAEAGVIEHHARPGELLVGPRVAARLHTHGVVHQLDDERSKLGISSVASIDEASDHESPWPQADVDALDVGALRPWLIPEVLDHALAGQPGFLAELRDATALFVSFDGLELAEAGSPERLDRVVRWIQDVLARHHGTLLQLTPTERGGFVYACFGAPRTVRDDAAAAVSSALELIDPPRQLGLASCQVGLARGAMRVGGYGGSDQCTYGAIGEQTNLAARLMQVAAAGELLADESVVAQSGREPEFVRAEIPVLKGVDREVRAFRYGLADLPNHLDELEPSLAVTVKVASVFTGEFDLSALASVHPDVADPEADDGAISEQLVALCDRGVLTSTTTGFVFSDPRVRSAAYRRLLYTQRRTLHREVHRHLRLAGAASVANGDELTWLRWLAHHAERAEDDEAATTYYEWAARAATDLGRESEALLLLEASLRVEVGNQPSIDG